MSQIGVSVVAQETPPAVLNTQSTANAFMVGFTDWGPAGSAGVTTPYTSLSQVATALFAPNAGLTQNARNSNNATLYDSADAFFREGGSSLYVSRVTGSPTSAGSISLLNGASVTATLTAAYVGTGSSSINVVIQQLVSAPGDYTVTLQDAAGNALATSPALAGSVSNRSDLIAWAATTGLVTAASGTSTASPASVGVLGAANTNPLSAGSDGRAGASIANWTSALNGFSYQLGPGQVMAPGQTNTGLSGIWTVLGNHALNNNRIALLDGTDGNTATQAISEVTTAAISSSLQSYCGLWVGNLQIPGITTGTTRVIPPSPVVAALCARVDGRGNPNQAAAGTSYALQYVSAVNTVYAGPLTGDIANLNSAGINVFSTQFNILQNYGFVSLQATPQTDAIYWQLNHGRTRMAIISQAQIVSQPYIFAQVDGQLQTITGFTGALQGMLLGFFNVGALYGASAAEAFTVDAGPTVNTTTSLSAGTLAANLAVRYSPFAQLVQIIINAVPITQNLVQVTA